MDKKKALDLLEQVVAEKGDGYVYEKVNESCLYAVYDEEGESPIAPSCIVGHWAVAAGVNLRDVARYEGRSADGVVPTLGLGISQFDDIATALQAAQTAQDAGATWGEALVAAKEILG